MPGETLEEVVSSLWAERRENPVWSLSVPCTALGTVGPQLLFGGKWKDVAQSMGRFSTGRKEGSPTPSFYIWSLTK